MMVPITPKHPELAALPYMLFLSLDPSLHAELEIGSINCR
jgi:hypothetical protein